MPQMSLLPSPKFNEEYFKSGNYRNYLARRFSQQANDIEDLGLVGKDDYVVDFGCATGGLIRALKDRGFTNLKGTDPALWAVEYGREKLGLVNELEYFNVALLSHQN